MAKKDNVSVWLKSVLIESGMKNRIDFTISGNSAFFHRQETLPANKRAQISSIMSKTFPDHSFEWDRNKLTWH